MSTKDHYSSYVTDTVLIENYTEYQKKYQQEPRESDKITIAIVKSLLGDGAHGTILDVGCSTGNFVRHLKRMMPDVNLVGSDLAIGFIEECRADESLRGIEFRVLDCTKLESTQEFDVITANAVTCLFDWPDYRNTLASVAGALKPNGHFVSFEWINPFTVQDLRIIETNDWNPDGMTLHFRPQRKVEAALTAAGFSSVEFRPFTLPIDLPFPGFEGDVVTYTRKDEHGERMAFRGVLYQPWCHLIARK